MDEKYLNRLQGFVLAGIFQFQNNIYHDLYRILSSECFINERCKFVYDRFFNILKENIEINFFSFENQCVKDGYSEYFTQYKKELNKQFEWMKQCKTTKKNTISFSKQLARRNYKHHTINSAKDLANKLEELPDDTESDKVRKELLDFLKNNQRVDRTDELELLGEGIGHYVDHLINGQVGEEGLDIGFPIFEDGSGGIIPGTVTVVVARFKTGKSIMLMNAAINVAMQGIPVLYMDMEMSKPQIIRRCLSKLTGINTKDIRTKSFNLDKEKVDKINEAGKILSNLPIVWKKIGSCTADKYLSIANQFIASHVGYNEDNTAKKCLIIVDYIKLGSGDLGGSEQEFKKLGDLATKVKDFAMDYQVPVITATQANRKSIDSPNGTDGVSGSDRILMYFDTAWMLRKKTDIEMAQDNKDFGGYAGNRILSQMAVRDAEGWEDNDYISLNFEGSKMNISEVFRRGLLPRTEVKQLPKKQIKRNDDIPV